MQHTHDPTNLSAAVRAARQGPLFFAGTYRAQLREAYPLGLLADTVTVGRALC